MIRPAATDLTRPVRLIAIFAIIAALYLARDLLRPVALAVLFTFLLYPLVYRMTRWGVHRVAAVIISVALATLVTAGVAWMVSSQVFDLVEKIPDYRENLVLKAREIRGSSSFLDRLSGTIQDVQQELAATQPTTQASGTVTPGDLKQDPTREPLKVQIEDRSRSAGDLAADVVGPILMSVGEAAAIIVLLLIFLLLYSDDIRERLVMFAGIRQISLTTAAVDEAGTRIGSYLRMQAIVNAIYGVMVAIALWCFGVPNALLWGVLGMLLRFVPYVGPWMATVLPTLLAIAVFPGWSRPLGVIIMFVIVEFTTNMILEPWLYGNSAGISTFGVVCAAVFWAWLWGPVGLILAVPLTVCLVVMGKYIPQLALLHQLFGDDVAVPAVGRLYQRLLVGDEPSAEGIVQGEIDKATFAEACDSLLLPALAELKNDLANGVVNHGQARRALRIIDLVCNTETEPAPAAPSLICIAGHNEVDACAARLLARAAAVEGVPAEVISSHALASEAAARVQETGAEWIVVVQVPPISALHSRHLLKTLAIRLGTAQQLIELAFSAAQKAGADANTGADPKSDEPRRERKLAPLVTRLKELASVKDPSPPAAAEADAVMPA